MYIYIYIYIYICMRRALHVVGVGTYALLLVSVESVFPEDRLEYLSIVMFICLLMYYY